MLCRKNCLLPTYYFNWKDGEHVAYACLGSLSRTVSRVMEVARLTFGQLQQARRELLKSAGYDMKKVTEMKDAWVFNWSCQFRASDIGYPAVENIFVGRRARADFART